MHTSGQHVKTHQRTSGNKGTSKESKVTFVVGIILRVPGVRNEADNQDFDRRLQMVRMQITRAHCGAG